MIDRPIPDGRKETLLSVPHYSFEWQLSYYLAEPKNLPKGTTIEAMAHFDNSANNPANPDPTKEVHFGEQSWDEMMFGFFDRRGGAGCDDYGSHAPSEAAAKG